MSLLTTYSSPQRDFQMIEFDNGYYQGEVFNSKREGFGVFYWDSGQIYIGKWIKDYMEDEGVIYFSDGGCAYGNFRRNKLSGYACVIDSNDNMIVGNFTKGVLESGVWNEKLTGKWYRYDVQNSEVNRDYELTTKSSIPQIVTLKEVVKRILHECQGRKCVKYIEYLDTTWYVGVTNENGRTPAGLGIMHDSDNKVLQTGYFRGKKLNGFGRQYLGFMINDGIFEHSEFKYGTQFFIRDNKFFYGFFNGNQIKKIVKSGTGYPSYLLGYYKHPSKYANAKVDKAQEQEVMQDLKNLFIHQYQSMGYSEIYKNSPNKKKNLLLFVENKYSEDFISPQCSVYQEVLEATQYARSQKQQTSHSPMRKKGLQLQEDEDQLFSNKELSSKISPASSSSQYTPSNIRLQNIQNFGGNRKSLNIINNDTDKKKSKSIDIIQKQNTYSTQKKQIKLPTQDIQNEYVQRNEYSQMLQDSQSQGQIIFKNNNITKNSVQSENQNVGSIQKSEQSNHEQQFVQQDIVQNNINPFKKDNINSSSVSSSFHKQSISQSIKLFNEEQETIYQSVQLKEERLQPEYYKYQPYPINQNSIDNNGSKNILKISQEQSEQMQKLQQSIRIKNEQLKNSMKQQKQEDHPTNQKINTVNINSIDEELNQIEQLQQLLHSFNGLNQQLFKQTSQSIISQPENTSQDQNYIHSLQSPTTLQNCMKESDRDIYNIPTTLQPDYKEESSSRQECSDQQFQKVQESLQSIQYLESQQRENQLGYDYTSNNNNLDSEQNIHFNERPKHETPRFDLALQGLMSGNQIQQNQNIEESIERQNIISMIKNQNVQKNQFKMNAQQQDNDKLTNNIYVDNTDKKDSSQRSSIYSTTSLKFDYKINIPSSSTQQDYIINDDNQSDYSEKVTKARNNINKREDQQQKEREKDQQSIPIQQIKSDDLEMRDRIESIQLPRVLQQSPPVYNYYSEQEKRGSKLGEINLNNVNEQTHTQQLTPKCNHTEDSIHQSEQQNYQIVQRLQHLNKQPFKTHQQNDSFECNINQESQQDFIIDSLNQNVRTEDYYKSLMQIIPENANLESKNNSFIHQNNFNKNTISDSRMKSFSISNDRNDVHLTPSQISMSKQFQNNYNTQFNQSNEQSVPFNQSNQQSTSFNKQNQQNYSFNKQSQQSLPKQNNQHTQLSQNQPNQSQSRYHQQNLSISAYNYNNNPEQFVSTPVNKSMISFQYDEQNTSVEDDNEEAKTKFKYINQSPCRPSISVKKRKRIFDTSMNNSFSGVSPSISNKILQSPQMSQLNVIIPSNSEQKISEFDINKLLSQNSISNKQEYTPQELNDIIEFRREKNCLNSMNSFDQITDNQILFSNPAQEYSTQNTYNTLNAYHSLNRQNVYNTQNIQNINNTQNSQNKTNQMMMRQKQQNHSLLPNNTVNNNENILQPSSTQNKKIFTQLDYNSYNNNSKSFDGGNRLVSQPNDSSKKYLNDSRTRSFNDSQIAQSLLKPQLSNKSDAKSLRQIMNINTENGVSPKVQGFFSQNGLDSTKSNLFTNSSCQPVQSFQYTNDQESKYKYNTIRCDFSRNLQQSLNNLQDNQTVSSEFNSKLHTSNDLQWDEDSNNNISLKNLYSHKQSASMQFQSNINHHNYNQSKENTIQHPQFSHKQRTNKFQLNINLADISNENFTPEKSNPKQFNTPSSQKTISMSSLQKMNDKKQKNDGILDQFMSVKTNLKNQFYSSTNSYQNIQGLQQQKQ